MNKAHGSLRVGSMVLPFPHIPSYTFSSSPGCLPLPRTLQTVNSNSFLFRLSTRPTTLCLPSPHAPRIVNSKLWIYVGVYMLYSIPFHVSWRLNRHITELNSAINIIYNCPHYFKSFVLFYPLTLITFTFQTCTLFDTK